MALKGKIYSIARQHDDLNTNELFQSMIDKSAAQDTIVMDGRNIAAGSIFAEQIHAGAITADKIRADAITADHMNVGSLSAISTNIGEITTGIIRSKDSGIHINLNTGTINLSRPLTINSLPVSTKKEVEDAIENIEVGGRNLFSTTRWMAQETRSGYYEVLPSGQLSILKVDALGINSYYTLANLEPNAEYIMSFSQPINDRFYLRNEDNENVPSLLWDWNAENTELRFKTPSTADRIVGKFYPIIQEYPCNVFVQIEKGNKATDWTPAPEDTQAKIDEKADTTITDGIQDKISDFVEVEGYRAEIGEINSALQDYKAQLEAGEISRDKAISDIVSLMDRTSFVENNLGEFTEKWNFLDTSITFGDEGILVGDIVSDTGIRISSGRIDFVDNGLIVAEITGQLLKINRGIFVRSAQIGEHQIETIAGGHTIWSWIPN